MVDYLQRSVLVLGGGMVGVCVALELQSRGAQVTLIDRKAPGQETSSGNAGVIARSSLIPMNNPGLWAGLPRLLTNRTASFRYDLPFLLRNIDWTAGFLSRARRACFDCTTVALDSLIVLSTKLHKELLQAAKATDLLSEKGWIFLYQTDAGYKASKISRQTFDAFGIDTEILDRDGITQLEPALRPVFSKAIWIKDACSVDDPGDLVTTYARLFADRGGKIERTELAELRASEGAWDAIGTDGKIFTADEAVVALGPWSREFLRLMGMRVPMAFERGYHMHYASGEQGSSQPLSRPIYDTAGGYVLAPMKQGLRLTTGVELADCDAPKNTAQLQMAERSARQVIDLGTRIDEQPWLGSRPTLPDSRPAIGQAPGRPGLFLAIGHQHIGLSTGPGTARVLADLMENKTPEIDIKPFEPARFIR